MTQSPATAQFTVMLTLQAAGPVRPRTKDKKHKFLRAEKEVTLPFAPFPGLYLTLSRPKKRGHPQHLFLRVRTVEWLMPENQFACVADEVLYSPVNEETMEVRGVPRSEDRYSRLEKALRFLDFEVTTNIDPICVALDKEPDGTASGWDEWRGR